jgi:mannosyltransferase
MHFWTAVAGTSVLDLRFPSIAAMAGAVALAGELGRRLFGPTVGVLAGVLLCLMPNMSRYAAEARPYAITCLFSIVAFLLLYRVLDRPGLLGWLAYGIAVLGLGLSHVVALAILSGHLAIVGLRSREAGKGNGSWRPAAYWAVTSTVALAIVTPLVWFGLQQSDTQLSWVEPLSIKKLYYFPEGVVGSVQVGWLLVGLIAVAAWRPTRRMTEMIVAAVLPLAAIALVSVLGSSFWVERYLLVVLAPTAILAAASLHRLSKNRWRLLMTSVIFAAAAGPGQVVVRGRTFKNGSDYRSTATIILHNQQPGDDIVYTENSRTLRAGLDYYLRNDPGRPRDVLLRRSAAAIGSLRAAEYSDDASRGGEVAARVGEAKRVWLMVYGVHNDPTTVRPDLQPLFRRDYQRVRIWHVHRATLELLARRAPTG